MNSNIHFIRRHPVYQPDQEPMVSLPLSDLNARIRTAIEHGVCLGAGIVALVTLAGIMIAGWAAA